MQDNPASERLVGVERQFEPLAEPTRDLLPLHLGGQDVHPSALALERDVGRGEVLRREHGRGQAVLRGPARVVALRHRAEHLAQADRLGRGQAQRPHHLRFGQPEQFAAGGGRAEHARGTGDVPPAIVVRGIDRIADAALHLDAEDQRMQEITAGDRLHFREREDRGRHGPGRVDHGLEVRVVEVEHVRAHAVHERRGERVHPLPARARRPVAARRTGRAPRWRSRASRAGPRPVHSRPSSRSSAALRRQRVRECPRGGRGRRSGPASG